MYRFVHQLNEIRKILIQFRFMEIAFDLIIIFLSFFLIFGIKSDWIFAPVLIYLVISLKYKFNNNIIKIIEARYPSLRERLSAAYDNKEEKNAIVEDLAGAISIDMEQVRYSSFISAKSLGIRIVIILLLVSMVLSTAAIDSPYLHTESKNNKVSGPDMIGSGQDTDIFTEPSFVRIGNDSEVLAMYRGLSSDQNVPGEIKQVPEYSRLFPEDAEATAPSQIYTESIPLIYQQIVKNYFTNLSG